MTPNLNLRFGCFNPRCPLQRKEIEIPDLENRRIFISHAWRYSEHYETLVRWFTEEPYFYWSNCSIPSDDAFTDKTSKGLSEGMRKQIAPAQVVIILGGMYATRSAWIDFEISEAKRMQKVIIGVAP